MQNIIIIILSLISGASIAIIVGQARVLRKQNEAIEAMDVFQTKEIQRRHTAAFPAPKRANT